MIERSDGRLCVRAAMVISNAPALLQAGRTAIRESEETIDLAAVNEADSAALAVMLAWSRLAAAENRRLHFVNIPAGVRSLADLYGVDELLPLA